MILAGHQFLATYDDPGDGGTIVPGYSAFVGLKHLGGAELRILGRPVLLGQRIVLRLNRAVAGSLTVQVEGGLNEATPPLQYVLFDNIGVDCHVGDSVELVGGLNSAGKSVWCVSRWSTPDGETGGPTLGGEVAVP